MTNDIPEKDKQMNEQIQGLTNEVCLQYNLMMHKLNRSKQVNMKVTPELHEQLRREAETEHISVSELLQKSYHFYLGYKYGLTQSHHKPQK